MSDLLRICIVEKDHLVAHDLAETVAQVLPLADCAIFHSVDAAYRDLGKLAAPDVVFVTAGSSGELIFSEEETRWVESSRVIAVDLQDRERYPTWHHLSKPFTNDEVVTALKILYAKPR